MTVTNDIRPSSVIAVPTPVFSGCDFLRECAPGKKPRRAGKKLSKLVSGQVSFLWPDPQRESAAAETRPEVLRGTAAGL